MFFPISLIFLFPAIAKIPLFEKILHEVLPFKAVADFAFIFSKNVSKSSMLKSGLKEIGKICSRDVSSKPIIWNKEDVNKVQWHAPVIQLFWWPNSEKLWVQYQLRVTVLQ